MLRSLYSGVSGMKSNQTKMDVIGNNIANSGTTAFKSGRVTFRDMLSQSYASATAPANGKGGLNPRQVGVGTAVASIDNDMSQGALQPTSRAGDLAIQGNGFFAVGVGSEQRYTRDGSFTLDSDGSLITSEGYHVLGQIIGGKVNTSGVVQDSNYINADDTLIVGDKDNQEAFSLGDRKVKDLENIVIPMNSIIYKSTGKLKPVDWKTKTGFTFTFTDGTDLNGWKFKAGANVATASTATSATVDKANKTITIDGDFTTAGAVSAASLQSAINAALKDAGISQSILKIDGTSTTGLVAGDSTSSFIVQPELAKLSAAGMSFELSTQAKGASDTDPAVYDLDGWSFEIGTVASTASDTTQVSVDTTNKVITMDRAKYFASSATDFTTLEDNINSKLKTAGIKQYISGVEFDDSTAGSTAITSTTPIKFDPVDLSKDKVKLTSFNIDKDGLINAIYGDTNVVVGKIPIVAFQNAAGLSKEGGNLYKASLNSGDPTVGEAASLGFGTIQQGMLEMSNVDLADQFTDMIVTSRAFQANSRSITTSDEMLQELLNLKR